MIKKYHELYMMFFGSQNCSPGVSDFQSRIPITSKKRKKKIPVTVPCAGDSDGSWSSKSTGSGFVDSLTRIENIWKKHWIGAEPVT
jgi:hypothetical protein